MQPYIRTTLTQCVVNVDYKFLSSLCYHLLAFINIMLS